MTPLQLPPRQQQFKAVGSNGSDMSRVLAAAGAVGGILGVQVRVLCCLCVVMCVYRCALLAQPTVWQTVG